MKLLISANATVVYQKDENGTDIPIVELVFVSSGPKTIFHPQQQEYVKVEEISETTVYIHGINLPIIADVIDQLLKNLNIGSNNIIIPKPNIGNLKLRKQ